MTGAPSRGGLHSRRCARTPAARALARAAVRILACLAAWTCGIAPAAADDFQLWPTFSVYSPPVDGWRGSAEIQVRWTDDLETYNRTIYRLNVGRSITSRMELFAGWEFTAPSVPVVRRENRLWEQVEYTMRPGRWSISNRARLEQRFVTGASEMASRLRYRLRVQHPLGHTKWTLAAGEELWLHLDTVRLAGTRGIDQNRLTFTGTRMLTPHLSVEPGYLYIDTNVKPPLRNRGAHVATLQVTARF